MTCTHCKANTPGTTLCTRCRTTLDVALQRIPADHAALFSLDTPTGQRRKTNDHADPTGRAVAARDRKPGRTLEDTAAEVTATLARWVARLGTDRPSAARRTPARTVPAMAAFLRTNLRTIATLDWAGELYTDLLATERRLHRVVARGQGRWYAGICGAPTVEDPGPDDWCPTDLYAQPGENYVRCTSCGAHWSIDDRRALVIASAREALLPITVVAQACIGLLGEHTSQQRLEARLRQWVARKTLADYGVRVLNGRPRRVYKLGEVFDLLARARRAEAAADHPSASA